MNRCYKSIKRIIKDDRAVSYAPVILIGTILIGVIILQFLSFTITKENAIHLKQEVLNETSYLNSAMAEVIYDDISSGTYSDFKSVVNSYKMQSVISNWKVEHLQNKLKIKVGPPDEDTRIYCGALDVELTNVNEETNTVTYVVRLYNAYCVADISGETSKMGNVVIYGSYTYNGSEDVDENEGNVAFNNGNVVTTDPSVGTVEDKLPEAPENPDINTIQ